MPANQVHGTIGGMRKGTAAIPRASLSQIVIGYDHSDEAEDAVALTHYLARRTGARATAVSCFGMDGIPAGERGSAVEERAAPLFGRLRAALGEAAITTRAMVESSAARGLSDAAAELDADLIVIGSTRRGKLGRVMPGSVGERLVQGGDRPVAVAPRGYAGRRHIGIGLIAVGYQAGPEGDAALGMTASLAANLDAAVRVITVFDARGYTPRYEEHLRSVKEGLQHDLAAAGEALSDIEHETVLLDGDPAAWLAEQGMEVDLLVLGSRGYGPLERALLGSVSGEVMRTAPCPVVVVPRPGGVSQTDD